MPQAYSVTFPAASVAAICALQVTSGAAALVLNGTTVYGPDTMVGVRRAFCQLQSANINVPPTPVVQATVSLTVAGANLSGVNFTITGKDLTGTAVTEVLAGPSSNTVFSVNQYAEVDSITTSGTVGTAVSAGWGTTGTLAWCIVDQFKDPTAISVWVVRTATISYTVQYAPDDPTKVASPTAFADPNLTAQTTNGSTSYITPPAAIRAIVNSSSGSGSITLTVRQAGLS